MGSQRHAQDPDSGPRLGPKLTLTGRLEGTCVGRQVELRAQGRELSLHVADLWSAWALRRNISAATAPVIRNLGSHDIRLRLNIGRRWRIELLPKSNPVVRWLFPDLRLSPAYIPGERS